MGAWNRPGRKAENSKKKSSFFSQAGNRAGEWRLLPFGDERRANDLEVALCGRVCQARGLCGHCILCHCLGESPPG